MRTARFMVAVGRGTTANGAAAANQIACGTAKFH
jgi:hypothetical protein